MQTDFFNNSFIFYVSSMLLILKEEAPVGTQLRDHRAS